MRGQEEAAHILSKSINMANSSYTQPFSTCTLHSFKFQKIVLHSRNKNLKLKIIHFKKFFGRDYCVMKIKFQKQNQNLILDKKISN